MCSLSNRYCTKFYILQVLHDQGCIIINGKLGMYIYVHVCLMQGGFYCKLT